MISACVDFTRPPTASSVKSKLQTGSCLSTCLAESPQRASWTFRLNAVTLIGGLMPTDPIAYSMIRLTTSARHQAVVGSSRHICVPPCDPNTTTTFIDPAKSCFIQINHDAI